MDNFKVYNKRMVVIFFVGCMLAMVGLTGRLVYLMIYKSSYYYTKAIEVQERERTIKAARGLIVDRNGVILGDNKTVCTVSVVYNQVTDRERVIEVLSKELAMPEDEVRKKVEKLSSREKIKSNVDKEIGDIIRSYDLDGVKVDEDYKRYYPFESLASKVIGFTGADNQGIIGLEVEYEEYLTGTPGQILTVTDARGVELDYALEERVEPIDGNTLVTSLDVNIQKYATQAAEKVLEAKQANYVCIIVMNPKNGEIYAMVNVPEFDLNDPFTLVTAEGTVDMEYSGEKQNLLNKMWRNNCINDTYEPGSTFKIVTASAALEEKIVTIDTPFSCPGYCVVDDRRIRCHKTVGHGAETFLQATMNSCNPVFVNTGLKLGVDKYYEYLDKFGLLKKTGVDLPGEAGTIIHKKENVGNVELATMSFGQSFQITPLKLLQVASAIVNGGDLVTPHFGVAIADKYGNVIETLNYETEEGVLSDETSETMRYMLGMVVSDGGGSKGAVEGYAVGGKTATSEKLPRGNGKYIASFIGFAPVDDPEVIAMCIVDEPTGIYYGGTVAAPVIRELYENILPYLNIKSAD
ncbi:MAG: peptidoglycan glycosyltransferase [Lachnospiraceae bacterium]|nr:peptidoglycan glycosyltransferase [Lachnospiraceae bacterium]